MFGIILPNYFCLYFLTHKSLHNGPNVKNIEAKVSISFIIVVNGNKPKQRLDQRTTQYSTTDDDDSFFLRQTFMFKLNGYFSFGKNLIQFLKEHYVMKAYA